MIMMPAIKMPSESEATYFTEAIVTWARHNYAVYPWRRTKNRWHALVAEVMLQRTGAEQVLPVYKAFCDQYETPRDYFLYADGTVFNSLGLKWREKKLLELAIALSEKDIPEDKELLLQLPGVGDYIAAAYRSLHLGRYDVIIDSNVVRFYGRYFGFETDGESRRKKELRALAKMLTPEVAFKTYNYGLIDFTRKTCKLKPLCIDCILKNSCNYNKAL